MFGRKRQEECPDPFKDKVKCEQCKHYIDKCDAQEVIHSDFFEAYEIYFCPMHRRSYDRRRIVSTRDEKGKTICVAKYFKHIPAHDEEVNQDGKPIKLKESK